MRKKIKTQDGVWPSLITLDEFSNPNLSFFYVQAFRLLSMISWVDPISSSRGAVLFS